MASPMNSSDLEPGRCTAQWSIFQNALTIRDSYPRAPSSTMRLEPLNQCSKTVYYIMCTFVMNFRLSSSKMHSSFLVRQGSVLTSFPFSPYPQQRHTEISIFRNIIHRRQIFFRKKKRSIGLKTRLGAFSWVMIVVLVGLNQEQCFKYLDQRSQKTQEI